MIHRRTASKSILLLIFLACFVDNTNASDSTITKSGLIVKTLSGATTSFKNHLRKDKWNIVFVWTTYCQHCTDQYQFLSELHNSSSHNTTVIGICLDKETSLELIKSTQERGKHKFPSVLANASNFSTAYEINTGEPFTGTPTYLIYRGYNFKGFLDGPTDKDTIKQFILKTELDLQQSE